MRITISARHLAITDDLKTRAEAAMQRLGRLSPHALEATVVFDAGRKPATETVEVRLHVRGGQIMVGQGDATDHRTALDRAEAKLRRQLDRARFPKRVRRPSASP